MDLRKLYAIMLILALVFFVGCSDDDDGGVDPTNPIENTESETLAKHLESVGALDQYPAMIKATDVNQEILTGGDIVVLDTRALADYDKGHIPGAIHVPANEVLDYYKNNGLSSKGTVAVTCYSGQGAGWVTGIMRMMGYTNVKDVKWGMNSWNPNTAGSWPSNISNEYAHELVTTPKSKPAIAALPTLTTGATGGPAILEARAKVLLSEGFGAANVSKSDVMSNPGNYYIVNYWSEEHYNMMHIDGAIQYTPKTSLKLDTDLKTLPTDKTIVVYCYTGQTSAHVSSYLRMLGYDAKSLLFGVNGLSYDAMPGTKFVEETDVHDYKLEGNDKEARTLVEYLEANGDFVNTAAPAMIKSTDVNQMILLGEDVTVLDIRAGDAYAAGHIKGAINVAPGDVLNYYESNGLSSKATVVIACYSGQTAGWVTGLMRLMGYDNVKDLKWGMCSWNESTSGSWNGNISNQYSVDMTSVDFPKPAQGILPVLSTGKTDGAEILRARVEAIFAEGFGAAKIKNSDVITDWLDLFLVNYWSEEHYNWNHLPSAMQYTPKASMKLDADLSTLPTDQIVVVYCYTGQTSAHMAAFLRVLGYDAKSLLFGMNGMSYDAMPGTKFVAETDVHDYELEL